MQKSSVRRNFRLSNEQKADAREAFIYLEGSGLKLIDAARIAMTVAGGKQTTQSATIEKAVDLFLKDRIRSKIRPSTYAYYESKLGLFLGAFPRAGLNDIQPADIKRWASDAPRYRAVRALYRFCLQHDPALCSNDPTIGLEPRTINEEEIKYLSVKEAKACMKLPKEHAAAAALLLFAGIRPDEMAGEDKPPLDWSNIDRHAKTIRVPATVAKTRRARILENLPENLWSWLEKGPERGPVCKISSRSLIRAMQRAGGFVEWDGHNENRLKPWPHDATRHSFITYYVALTGDTGRTSLIVGHEGRTSLIHQRYRGMATERLAKQYFAITS